MGLKATVFLSKSCQPSGYRAVLFRDLGTKNAPQGAMWQPEGSSSVRPAAVQYMMCWNRNGNSVRLRFAKITLILIWLQPWVALIPSSRFFWVLCSEFLHPKPGITAPWLKGAGGEKRRRVWMDLKLESLKVGEGCLGHQWLWREGGQNHESVLAGPCWGLGRKEKGVPLYAFIKRPAHLWPKEKSNTSSRI